MKKIVFITILILLTIPLFSSPFNDVAFNIGGSNFSWSGKTLDVSYGINVGLTKDLELNFRGFSQVIPKPFSDNIFIAELDWSFLGPRSSGTKVSGQSTNMLLSIGAFYRTKENGVGICIGLTPFALGSPTMGRRERLFRTDLLYDFINNRFTVALSFLDFDLYIKGTYRDYY